MTPGESRVTIHMAASLDGFIARKDGRVDWLETSDVFDGGTTMDPAYVEAALASIDCYVMGSRTYETALRFESQGFGWAYGDKPVYVLTSRTLPRTRETVHFHSGDLSSFVNAELRPQYRSIWFVGGSRLSADCLRLGLADEIRMSLLPVVIGDGIRFFDALDRDVALHLTAVTPYANGMVELRYQVRNDDAVRNEDAVRIDLQPTLRGELIELRPMRPDDWDALFAVAADPLLWEQHPASNRYQEAVFREFFRDGLATGSAFVAIDVQTGRIIGSSRYHGHNVEASEIEIGWTFLARQYWGGTYNGEMKRLMLDHAFQFVNRVVFMIGAQNTRSRRAVERIGGVLLPDHPAVAADRVVYGITKAQWT